MYDDILVPTDGSEGALDAVRHAVAIGRDHDATVHALFVVNRRLYVAADDGEQDAVRERLREDGEAALDDVVAAVEDAGLAATRVLRDGVPHREILSYADEADVDMVVMGTHGRTGRDRLVSLGSVAERVVESATVPVVTVRIPDDGGTGEEASTAASGAPGDDG
ncbi:MAG: universal stress protein [Halobacteriaceae archaeon]